MTLTLLTGLALLVSAGACALSHMLLNPKTERWRSAPRWYLAVLFIFTVVNAYLGQRFLAAALDGVDAVPPDASGAVSVLSFAVCIYMVGTLIRTFLKERWASRVAFIWDTMAQKPPPAYSPQALNRLRSRRHG